MEPTARAALLVQPRRSSDFNHHEGGIITQKIKRFHCFSGAFANVLSRVSTHKNSLSMVPERLAGVASEVRERSVWRSLRAETASRDKFLHVTACRNLFEELFGSSPSFLALQHTCSTRARGSGALNRNTVDIILELTLDGPSLQSYRLLDWSAHTVFNTCASVRRVDAM